MPKNHPEQENQPPMQRNQAGTTFSLRLIAAGYLLYLAWTLLRDNLNGITTLPLWLGWTAAIGFALAGAAFGWYAWQRYRTATAAKEKPGMDCDDESRDAMKRADESHPENSED